MTHLNAIHPDQATGKLNDLFGAINNTLGMVPNMMRTMGNSPELLEAYLNYSGTLSKGRLGNKLGSLIALAVAEANHCNYCVAAHSFLGKNLNGLDESKINAARTAGKIDPKTDAALSFARSLVVNRGKVNGKAEVGSLLKAGFTEGEVAEIIGHVAVNIFTNYFNIVANTEIDEALAAPAFA